MVEQVADKVFRVGGSSVNCYIAREGRQLTLFDTGYPHDAARLEDAIRQLGHRVEDVQAVLLTHAHVDHSGGLNRLWDAYRIPVYMHPLEVAIARGLRHEQATPWDVARRIWKPRVALWCRHVVQAGGTQPVAITHARAFPRAGALDLPGSPVPVHCAGHTSGHTAYLLADSGALITGDALNTGHAISSRVGPQVLPGYFSQDPKHAYLTLDRLAREDADLMLPGHGLPWRGELARAVAEAREHAPRAFRP
ncbi:MBL fold metallo-hydrolase [Nocardia fluminea]|uniref:MBL fold metallo-hydrolase n=1 Tax=Nocardia fluminea TaxID=134984 RepID=UPI0033EDD0C9